MIIKIKPIDMLFFRDGKPFVRGEDVWTNSLVLPNLPTVYGVLRSAYFALHMDKMGLAATKDDPTLKLQVKRVLPVINGSEVLYPAPLDLVCDKEDSKGDNGVYNLIRMQAVDRKAECSLPAEFKQMFVLQRDGKQLVAETVPKLYLTAEDMKKYLYGNAVDGYTGYSLDSFVEREPRINIARRDQTRAVEDGMLYRIDQIRYKNMELLIEFDGLDLPEQGYLKIGGKGNAVRYEQFKPADLIDGEDKKADKSIVKLYLSSPAIFKNGWMPDFISEGKGVLDGKQVEFLGACISKPDFVGGYDIKNRIGKPVRKIACAGNVYLFNLEDACQECRVKGIKLDTENSNEGYGKGLLIYE